MAVGDRITSARIAGFMRRVNALEELDEFEFPKPIYRVVADDSGGSQGTQYGGVTMYPQTGGAYVYASGLVHNDYAIFRGTLPITGNDQFTGLVSDANINSFSVGENLIACSTHINYTGPNTIKTYNLSGTLDAVTFTSDEVEDPPNYPYYTFNGACMVGSTVMAMGYEIVDGPDKRGILNASSGTFYEDSELRSVGGGAQILGTDTHCYVMYSGSPGITGIKKYTTSGVLAASSGDINISQMYGFDDTGQYLMTKTTTSSYIKFFDLDLDAYVPSRSYYRGLSTPDLGGSACLTENAYMTHYVGSGAAHTDEIYIAVGNRHTEYHKSWYRYPTRGSSVGAVSLGTSDFGVSVPADSALVGHRPHGKEIRDIQDALTWICRFYANPATGEKYTTGLSTDNNIFRIAIHPDQYWWSAFQDVNDRILEKHFNDIELILTQLEGSLIY